MSRTIITALALLLLAHGAPPRAQTDDRGASIWKGVGELPAREKRWALVIGVDKYQDANLSSLSGAANDARALADALTRYAGFPDGQVTLLTTDAPPGRQPTRANILSSLHDLAADAPRDGLLLVFFAGHGIARDDSRAYLLPSDARLSEDTSLLDDTAINVEQMRKYIRATGIRQLIVILDACRNDPTRARGTAPNVLTTAYTRAFNFDVRNREVIAFVTIYATAVGQRAYEDGDRRQGYFTRALVEGMGGGAKNSRGEVTLAALVDYVQKRVPELVGRRMEQKPWAEFDGYLANQLVVAVAGPPPLAESNPTPTPSAPSDADDGFKALDEAMRRTSSQPGRGTGGITMALFDCLSVLDPKKACYLTIFGEGWGGADVTVTMNGRDISSQLAEQDDRSITLKGDKQTLNFISGTNVVTVKAGANTFGPFSFAKIIK